MENTAVDIEEKFGISANGHISFKGIAELVSLEDVKDIIEAIERIEMNKKDTVKFMHIGSGAFMDVYSCGENLAIKRTEKEFRDEPDDDYDHWEKEQYIYNEFNIGIKLNKHDVVAKTYALVETENHYYIATERIMGVEVGRIYDGGDLVPSEEIDCFFDKAYKINLEGFELNDLHDGNIMVDFNGRLKIVDVGLFSITDKARTKDVVMDRIECIEHLLSIKKNALVVEEFKESLSRKNNVDAKDIVIESNLKSSCLDIGNNLNYKGLISSFMDIIVNKRYLDMESDNPFNLHFCDSGMHSSVYSFEFEENKYVLKIQEKEIEEQKDIMNRLRTIDLFAKNITYYHDKNEDVLYTLQEFIEEQVGTENSGTLNLSSLNSIRFKNDLIRVFKAGLVPDDLHRHNICIDKKTSRLLCFDVSNFYRSNVKWYEDIAVDKESIIEFSGANWYDNSRGGTY